MKLKQGLTDLSFKRLTTDFLTKLYGEWTAPLSLLGKITLSCEQVKTLLNEGEAKLRKYDPDVYQCMIAAIIAAWDEPFTIAVLPTGSGKTWIILLLCLLFLNNGKYQAILIIVASHDLAD